MKDFESPVLVDGKVIVHLEEFNIGNFNRNYTIKGEGESPKLYEQYDCHLVYVGTGELEMVKNFLLTIRD
jgi:hypothetical protein